MGRPTQVAAKRSVAPPNAKGNGAVVAVGAGATTAALLSRVSIQAGIVFAVAVACFANAIVGDYTFDDNTAVIDNADVSGNGTLVKLLYHDFWGTPMDEVFSHKSWRPLTVLSFRVVYRIFGSNATWQRLVNVLIHGIVSAMCIPTLRALGFADGDVSDAAHSAPGARGFSVFAAALIFAAHPVHTDCIPSVVGRAELLCLLGCLCAVLCHCRAVADGCVKTVTPRAAWTLGCVTAVALSLMTKEIAFMLPPMLVAHDLIRVLPFGSSLPNLGVAIRRTLSQPERRRLGTCILQWFSLAVVSAIYLSFRASISGSRFFFSWHDVHNPLPSLATVPKVMTICYLHTIYAKLLVAPISLSCDYSLNAIPPVTSIADPRNMLTLTVYAGLLWVLYFTLVRLPPGANRKRASLALAWLVAFFVPSSQVFFPIGTYVAERLLYTPSLGYCALVAVLADIFAGPAVSTEATRYDTPRRGHQRSSVRRLSTMFLVALVVLYAGRTFVRNADWRNNGTLFKSAIEQYPANAKMQMSYGVWQALQGDTASAKRQFENAVAILPTYASPYTQLGTLYTKENRIADAEPYFRRAVELDGEDFTAITGLGQTLTQLGQYEEGKRLLEHGLSLRALIQSSELASPLNNLGNAKALLGDVAGSIDAFRRSLEINPAQLAPRKNIYVVAKSAQLQHVFVSDDYLRMCDAKNVDEVREWALGVPEAAALLERCH